MIKFIAIEGIDGSGKSTQIKLLLDHITNLKLSYKYIHFPRYENGIFGKMIADFLKGIYGPVNKVNPYLVALLFAMDRNDIKHRLKYWLRNNNLILVDRYVYSNIAFQCAKIRSIDYKLKLQKWIIDLEYYYNKIPKPDLSFFLFTPFSFVEKQLNSFRLGKDRGYLTGLTDIHESNLSLQHNVQEEYIRLTNECKDFLLINCYERDGSIKDQKLINNNIISILENKGFF